MNHLRKRRRLVPVVWQGVFVGIVVAAADQLHWWKASFVSAGWQAQAPEALATTAVYCLVATATLLVLARMLRPRRPSVSLRWLSLGVAPPIFALCLARLLSLPAEHWPGAVLHGLGTRLGMAVALAAVAAITIAAVLWVAGHVERRSPRAFIGGCAAFVVFGASSALWQFGPVAATSNRGHEQPFRAILITIDALIPRALGCYGGRADCTPAIDSLAARGTRFDCAISQAPWTRASMGSLLTGTYPTIHGAGLDYRRGLNKNIPTLPEVFAKAGIPSFGYVCNVNLSPEFGFGRGFTQYVTFTNAERQRALRAACSTPLPVRFFTGLRLPALSTLHVTDMSPSAESLTDRAIDTIQRHAEDSFFIWLHYLDPHEHDRYRIAMHRDSSGGVQGVSVDHTCEGGWQQTYYDNVRYVDWQISRILQALKRAKIERDTLIIVTADHGEEFGTGVHEKHGKSLGRAQLHLPLVLQWPAAFDQAGTVSQTVRLIDIPATLLDAAGMDSPASFQGTSLLPLAKGAEEPDRPAFSECLWPGARMPECNSLILGKFQGLYWVESGAFELHEQRADNAESIVPKGQYALLRSEFSSQILNWMSAAAGQAAKVEAGEKVTLAQTPDMAYRLRSLGYYVAPERGKDERGASPPQAPAP